MSEEGEDTACDDGTPAPKIWGTPARKIWSTPALTAVAADDAAAVMNGFGVDGGLYS